MVADEFVCDETGILEETIPRILEVMQRIADYSCNYVSHGHFSRQSPFLIWHVLMIAGRTVGNLVDPGTIEEMEEALTKVIVDFDRAVEVSTLRKTQEIGEPLLVMMGLSQLLC